MVNVPREDGTEVLQEKEDIKPATEGTWIPYEARSSQSTINTHTTTIKSYPYHNHEMLCHFFNDANASMSSTINSF